MASALSRVLTVCAAAGRRAAGAVVERDAAAGAAPRCATGAAAGVGALEARDGSGGVLGAPVGPPGGSVGSLMVGAAEGFGGKLMRTVSFFGWTLPVSFFGGTAPPGAPGIDGGMSAIVFALQDKSPSQAVKPLFQEINKFGATRQTTFESSKVNFKAARAVRRGNQSGHHDFRSSVAGAPHGDAPR